MIKKLFRFFASFLPTDLAYAHCDVPCGIYDPKPAQIAAAAVKKMVEKIENPPDRDEKDIRSVRNFHNSMTRFVMTKEKEAQKCKEEILILWTDYFKPEHLKQFPNLHDTFWKAAKLCSTNKQEVSIEHADELVSAVNEIARIFEQSKKATK